MSKRNSNNDGIQGTAPKFERNVARTSQRGYSASGYYRMRGHERLSGGADAKSKSTLSISKDEVEANSRVAITPAVASNASNVAPEAEREIEAILAKSNDESTGDKKVDEMIDYVIQNLQEAGKALASLGENFEHDLKLMFVDVMGKVQNWVSVAQIRLDAARNDINNLRKELVSRSNEIAARDQEIGEVKKKLAESQAANSLFEIALAENTQKSAAAVSLPSPSTMSFIPSRQPLSGVEVASAPSSHLEAQSSHSVPPATASEHPISGDATSRVTLQREEQIVSETQKSAQNKLDRSQQKIAEAQSSVQIQRSRSSQKRAEEAESAAQIQRSRSSQQRAEEAESAAQSQRSRPSQQRAADVRATADVAVQSGKGKDRKRESELESELIRLRNENERIAKERADYENAIQRALLRGVSSLNAETLKVLRCPPPISCYVPCGPPPSPVNTVEKMIPCPSTKTRANGMSSGCKTAPAVSSRPEGSKMHVDATFSHEEHVCCGVSNKGPATSSRGSSSRHRKSSGSSTRSAAFILQQAASPTACFPPCIVPQSRTCRPKSKKLEASICTRKFQ